MCRTSLSARRAWIEIACLVQLHLVAVVALRKESVDRNENQQEYNDFMAVALRKESVDRNAGGQGRREGLVWSLSARRAWIEIDIPPNLDADHAQSLSARRAWIEISCCVGH